MMLTGDQPLIVGNWKMHGLRDDLDMIAGIDAVAGRCGSVDVALCLPATLIHPAAVRATRLAIGAQDCHPHAAGAWTGGISAAMIADAGGTLVIVGHSETRAFDDDGTVGRKAAAALQAGLRVILCVGETADQRAAGDGIRAVSGQLAASLPHGIAPGDLAVAYEPSWAIGGDASADPAAVSDVAHALRTALECRLSASADAVPILYGGAVRAASADRLLRADGISGLLVGRASRCVEEFAALIETADALGRRHASRAPAALTTAAP